MRIFEAFTCAKSGDENLNEDGYFINDGFVAVIDGVTSKTKENIFGISLGRFAMLTLKSAFADADVNWDYKKTLSFINERLYEAMKKIYKPDIKTGCAASVIYCNLKRKEIVSYGDCAYAVNGKVNNEKKISDLRLAQKRAEILKHSLASGKTLEELRKNDIGRAVIINELILQAQYANKPIANGYPCLNGGDIVHSFIKMVSLSGGEEIILCSDGYPVIENTLLKSEETLMRLLKKDPLCISDLLGTKGVSLNNVSYDDRTYVRFNL